MSEEQTEFPRINDLVAKRIMGWELMCDDLRDWWGRMENGKRILVLPPEYFRPAQEMQFAFYIRDKMTEEPPEVWAEFVGSLLKRCGGRAGDSGSYSDLVWSITPEKICLAALEAKAGADA